MKITPEQLLQLGDLSYRKAKSLCESMDCVCPRYKINTPLRVSAWIAQMMHESDFFEAKEENLRYSADRLMKVFKNHFPDVVIAGRYSGNPEAIANLVYANRMGNGDEASGDGYRFRGGGFLQITGKDMYTKFAKLQFGGLDSTVALIRESDQFAMESAAWLFAVEKDLLPVADRGDFITITKRINGGLNGQPERVALYEKAKAIWLPK